ncbi:MAG: biotin holocarboxylase synthetase, partial [Pleopsidium flavum]
MELTSKAPIVFVQYLAAMAIVEGIKTYDKGYQDVPVKLKWPNDICKQPFCPIIPVAPLLTQFLDALDPSKPKEKTYVKIGGILVNSHYSSSEYLAVVGI